MEGLGFSIYLLAGLFQIFLSTQVLSELAGVQRSSLISSTPSEWPIDSFELFEPAIGELIQTQCQDVPSGVGIPAFQPGIVKDDVMKMLGVPNRTTRGYWPNTLAVSYELVPEQVSLGFLFDKNSQRIRQTEASFTRKVDTDVVLLTLNGMLGCRINDQITEGLQQVWQRESWHYNFKLDTLEGVIHWDKRDRLYIGIWEADLH